MATRYKVLGQVATAATTATTLYTVGSLKDTVTSSIVVSNRAATGTTFRIAVRPAGAALANQHYLAYDTSILANDSVALTLGITLSATDVVTVYAGNANLTFSLFGSEIDL
jgi:glucose-6-phosphate dehydrogenase assembly protein OpcA